MIKVGDIIQIKGKDYTILAIDREAGTHERFYTAKTTVNGYYSLCVLKEDENGNLYVY